MPTSDYGFELMQSVQVVYSSCFIDAGPLRMPQLPSPHMPNMPKIPHPKAPNVKAPNVKAPNVKAHMPRPKAQLGKLGSQLKRRRHKGANDEEEDDLSPDNLSFADENADIGGNNNQKFVSGYLEKGYWDKLSKISSTERWHKRWFYLNMATGKLCYLKKEPSTVDMVCARTCTCTKKWLDDVLVERCMKEENA